MFYNYALHQLGVCQFGSRMVFQVFFSFYNFVVIYFDWWCGFRYSKLVCGLLYRTPYPTFPLPSQHMFFDWHHVLMLFYGFYLHVHAILIQVGSSSSSMELFIYSSCLTRLLLSSSTLLSKCLNYSWWCCHGIGVVPMLLVQQVCIPSPRTSVLIGLL